MRIICIEGDKSAEEISYRADLEILSEGRCEILLSFYSIYFLLVAKIYSYLSLKNMYVISQCLCYLKTQIAPV